MHVGFIDPHQVNNTMMKSADLPKTEDYVLKCLLELQLKKYILLPYHLGYVFPSLHGCSTPFEQYIVRN